MKYLITLSFTYTALLAKDTPTELFLDKSQQNIYWSYTTKFFLDIWQQIFFDKSTGT